MKACRLLSESLVWLIRVMVYVCWLKTMGSKCSFMQININSTFQDCKLLLAIRLVAAVSSTTASTGLYLLVPFIAKFKEMEFSL